MEYEEHLKRLEEIKARETANLEQLAQIVRQQAEIVEKQREIQARLQTNPWFGVPSPDFKGILDTLGLDVEANRHRDS